MEIRSNQCWRNGVERQNEPRQDNRTKSPFSNGPLQTPQAGS